MNRSAGGVAGVLATVVIAGALVGPAPAGGDRFELAHVIPNDVFVYAGQRHNPDREFLYEYWGEFFDALWQSGVDDDVVELFAMALGVKSQAEVERINARISQLLDGVDWEQLGGKEHALAERFVLPTKISDDRPPVLLANMVWISRGSADGAARHYEGLVAILEGIADEINRAVAAEVLVVEKTTRDGTEVASVDLLGAVPGAPPLPLSVAVRDDVLLIALREHLVADVLDLLGGKSTKTPLADDPRFKSAFATLPPAADSMEFFDVQALMDSLRAVVDVIIDAVGGPQDEYTNTGMPARAGRLNHAALSAYRRGDMEEALELVEQAYEIAPQNSIVLYNLACFSALLDKREEALTWLEKAVEGGFWAPGKIAADYDLAGLRSEPRYRAALDRAAELAAQCCAEDIVINGPKKGEPHRLLMQAWQAYTDEHYEQGLKLVEQAYAVDPQHSRVLYGLACFHALLGHDDQALHFLEKAVDAGFYCPRHMASDPDLDNLRTDQRYQAAVATARQKAAELTLGDGSGEQALVRHVFDRLVDVVGILDYCATVESTDGYSVRADTIAVLVPDAEQRPMYAVFAKRPQLTEFDRYLPKETASFSVSGGLDLGELYQFIEDTFRAAGPRGEELLAKWAGLQKQFGIDVRQDVIDWIEGDFVSVTLADGGGSVWLIKVSDEQLAREKVAAAIEFLSTTLSENLSELAAQNPALVALAAMATVQTSPAEGEQLEGFENVQFAMSPEPAVWGVTDGHLIFGSSADAVTLCLATARGDHPSIRENADVMSEAVIPSGSFVGVSLADRRDLGERIAAGLGVGSMVCGVLGAAMPEPEARPVLGKISSMLSKVAPVVRKINFYKSTAGCTTFDGRAWHTRVVTHYASPAERNKAPAH